MARFIISKRTVCAVNPIHHSSFLIPHPHSSYLILCREPRVLYVSHVPQPGVVPVPSRVAPTPADEFPQVLPHGEHPGGFCTEAVLPGCRLPGTMFPRGGKDDTH